MRYSSLSFYRRVTQVFGVAPLYIMYVWGYINLPLTGRSASSKTSIYIAAAAAGVRVSLGLAKTKPFSLVSSSSGSPFNSCAPDIPYNKLISWGCLHSLLRGALKGVFSVEPSFNRAPL
jgi:hypothetical protein